MKIPQGQDKLLSTEEQEKLMKTLRDRFEANMHRHSGLDWEDVQAELGNFPEKLWSLNEMERTGGEPDIVNLDKNVGQFVFYDCSPESPSGRRSLCYDREALESRKANKPEGDAVSMAEMMGIEMLTETQYYALQNKDNFDTKTSSWLKTPPSVRELGGAIFGDCRYERVFVYHNGAQSYYSSRGFRGMLRL